MMGYSLEALGTPGADSQLSSVNKHLARAIVAAFREAKRDALYRRLAAYTLEDWSRSRNWLDASGLELYFLERLKTLGIEDAVPIEVRVEMEQNFADNKIRTAKLFEEFVRINQAFQREQLNYCNVTGISLVPVSCPDPALRRQISMDFMMAGYDSSRCESLLVKLGYVAHIAGERSREFRPDSDVGHFDKNIYRSIAERSIVVYFLSDDAVGTERAPFDMLMRRRTQTWDGYRFPALTECDHFIAQTIRMLGHVGIEWSRLALLLEFKTCLHFWLHDEAFWREVADRAQEHPLRSVAIGTVTRLAAEIFGLEIPLSIQDWVTNSVDAQIRQWSEVYGWETLLTEFPGTTLLALFEGRPR
jgi:hypothetical protein